MQTLSGNTTLNIGPNQTLQGSMNALTPQLLINNSGTINANVANTTISIFYPSATALNNGTLESTNGGTHSQRQWQQLHIEQRRRPHQAATGSSNGTSNVTINALNISGGQLSTDATGQISFQTGAILTGASASGNLFFSSVALANDTLSGNITQTGCVTLTGTVTNNANWTQSSSGNSLNISNMTTLDGNGTITLSHALLQTLSGNATLNIGPNQTLQGSMNVPQSQLLINNSGTAIAANVANATISIFYPSTTAFNNGTLKSTNGGTLILNGGGSNCTLNNAGGIISATGSSNGTASNVTINALNISGGQLSTDAIGQILFQSAVLTGASVSGNLVFSSITLANDTLSGIITQTGSVSLSGTVTNNANWTQSSSGNSLNVSNITTLDGNGTITLFHANLQTLSGNTTLNVGPNQTLQGSMNALTPQLLINNSGTINANQPATTLTFVGSSLTNTGLIEATNGANFRATGHFANAGTLVIGPNSTFTVDQLLMQSGMLAGSGTVAGAVVAGSLPHTIHPGMPGTTVPGSLTLSALSTNSATTLTFNLAAPEKAPTPGSNDQLVISGASALSLNGGAIAITSAPAGPASLGYYSIIHYTTSFTGSLASLSLPISTTANIVYTLDTTHDPGFIDLHIGLLGDANDDGAVDLTDLSTILNNFGSSTSAWTNGNFDGSPTIDLTDLSYVLNNFGKTFASVTDSVGVSTNGNPVAAPEPASLAVLAISIVCVNNRRSRRSEC